jgi:hypothetical protein
MMRYAFDGIRLGPYLIDLKIAERAAFFAEAKQQRMELRVWACFRFRTWGLPPVGRLCLVRFLGHKSWILKLKRAASVL